MARKIYVASSWRNKVYEDVVADLKAAGHEVYDFRNPGPGDKGFSWAQVDPNWQDWGVKGYLEVMGFGENPPHRRIEQGYSNDINALDWCDTLVLVMPSGRSAHIEAGYAVGRGKQVFVLLNPEGHEPDLMYLMCDGITDNLDTILHHIKE